MGEYEKLSPKPTNAELGRAIKANHECLDDHKKETPAAFQKVTAKIEYVVDVEEAREHIAILASWWLRRDTLPHHLRQRLESLMLGPTESLILSSTESGGVELTSTPDLRALVGSLKAYE
jgi:hypothetical protein